MNCLSKKIADWCLHNQGMEPEQFEIVVYGINLFFNTTLKICGLLMIGILLSCFTEVVVVLTVFCGMRYFAGGIHCKTDLGCFGMMLVTCFLPILLMRLDIHWALPVWVLMAVFSAFAVIKYAPRNSEVNPVADPVILKRKRIGGLVLCGILIIVAILCGDTGLRWLLMTPMFVEAMTILP